MQPGSGELLMSGQNVRQSLALLRQRWDRHSPVSPMCLAETLVDGVSISDFCVAFLLMQRSRRGSTPKVVVPETVETETEAPEPQPPAMAPRSVAVTRASAAAAACAGV